MDKQAITQFTQKFMQDSGLNTITKEQAMSDAVVGMQIYKEPLIAYGSTSDELFAKLKHPNVVGEMLLLPDEWLPGAKTVISFFFPFTEEVRLGNGKEKEHPSQEWLHGRWEGQTLINEFMKAFASKMKETGYNAVVPLLDPRFTVVNIDPMTQEGYDRKLQIASSWSERHAAFICGQGTFGLSKAIITKEGIAGRLGSIITDIEFEPTKREYTELYEYCIMCGACVRNCPADAISIENGKDHIPCEKYVNGMKEYFNPRYGCGKCQVKVPCQSRIPLKRKG